jgi:hypothetical protein
MQGNPLYVPELIDICIAHLRESRTDLRSCALVCRGWVYSAQECIFEGALLWRSWWGSLDDYRRRWRQLLAVLASSPHLIHHIRRLDLNVKALSHDRLIDQIARVPFSHLCGVILRNWSRRAAPAVTTLLALTTLRHVDLVCEASDPTRFADMWDACSRSVRSVAFQAFQKSQETLSPVFRKEVPPLALRALEVKNMSGFIPAWLEHARCPLQFSGLRILAVHNNPEILRWRKLGPALPHLEALQFWVRDVPRNIETRD